MDGGVMGLFPYSYPRLGVRIGAKELLQEEINFAFYILSAGISRINRLLNFAFCINCDVRRFSPSKKTSPVKLASVLVEKLRNRSGGDCQPLRGSLGEFRYWLMRLSAVGDLLPNQFWALWVEIFPERPGIYSRITGKKILDPSRVIEKIRV